MIAEHNSPPSSALRILEGPGWRFAPNSIRFMPKARYKACRRGQSHCIVSREMVNKTRKEGVQGHRLLKRRIVVVVVPPVEELDLVGPVQVLSAANRLAGKKVYSIEIVTNAKDLTVEGEGGVLSFLAQGRLQDLRGKIDSVLLVCGVGTRLVRDPALSAWMRNVSPVIRRFGGVCVGSFLLAEAGLLNGKRATTHWKFGRELAKRYPKVRVESDPIWVKDGNIYTSAGISAGIDLALAWVEEDCGGGVAQAVAHELVLFLRRHGGQQQLSVSLASQASELKSIQELQIWMADNLQRELSVQALAERVAMSVRNFERVFTREVGSAPSRYVAQLRVEAARRQLAQTEKSIDQIAASCGFGSADLMRRAFVRTIGVTPTRYRKSVVSLR